MSFIVKDANSTNQTFSTSADASGYLVGSTTLRDATTGANSAVVDAAGRLLVKQDSAAATYRAAIFKTLDVATPTAIVVMQGSASKTILLKRIFLQGWSTTSGVMKFKLSRRSTAGTAGSAVLTAIPTQGEHRTSSAASTLTISTVGTANYGTLGTLTSILDVGVVGFNKAAETVVAPPVVWPHGFNGDGGAGFELSGTSDWITIDGGADAGGDAVPAGGILLVSVEWEEV